ncbi:hypothetical protein [Methanocella sp.]|uniref:hypothetical protein n=1 Tax=Methanocella sp. TaxID=2052833 RepID=UPI002D7EAAEE|nr:hypothetical protein [Methanocella sp.]
MVSVENIFIAFLVLIGTLVIFNIKILREKISFEVLGKIFFFIIPIVAIAGITLPLIIGEYSFSLLGSYLAVPMILGPLAYYIYFNKLMEFEDNGTK